MRPLLRLAASLALGVLTACGQDGEEGVPDAVRFSPADTATLWAPGLLSTAAPEFAAALAPDGSSVYFNRASPDRSQLSILESSYRDGRWSEPVAASFSGTHRDIDPFVTADGERLYFSSNRPLMAGDTSLDFNTWYVERTAEGWSEPQALNETVNSPGHEVFVSLDRNNTLYFSSDRDDTQRVYRSRWSGAQFEPPELVSIDLNVQEGVGNPLIDASGTILYMVSDRPGGAGGADLYVACERAGEWSAAANLGPLVNSQYADFAPALSPDGRYLIFTSERPGIVPAVAEGERPPGDLYYIEVRALSITC